MHYRLYSCRLLIITILIFSFNWARGNEDNLSLEKRFKETALITNIDSALGIYQDIYTLAKEKKDTLMLINILIKKGHLHSENGNYVLASEHYFEANYWAKQTRDTCNIIRSNIKLGGIYEIFSRRKESQFHYKFAHKLTKRIQKKNGTYLKQLLNSYYHLHRSNRQFGDLEQAQKYLDSCLTILDTLHAKGIMRCKYKIESGYLKYLNKESEKAIEILLEQKTTLHQILNNNNEKKVNSLLIFLNAHLADIYFNKLNYNKASEYYILSLGLINKNEIHKEFEAYLRDKLSKIYELLGDYRNAYKNIEKAKTVSDKYFGVKNLRNKDVFDFRNQFMKKLEEKDKALIAQDLKLVKKEKENLRLKIIFIVIFLLIIISFFLVMGKIQIVKTKEKEKQTKLLLEYKNKELTSQSLRFIEMQELISRSAKYIKKGTKNKETQSLLQDLKNNSGSIWEEFNKRFNSVNVGFYDRLITQYPELSSNDLKICALIKLNFSSKEMARLLGISPSSVDIARHRLRSKMNLDFRINLITHITKI